MCSSLDGSHSLAITNTAAICAHGTASRPAGRSAAHRSSSRSDRHSVHPSQTSPNARVRSTRSPLSRTATVCSPVAVSSNSSCCSLPPVICCASSLARARPSPSSSPRCATVSCTTFRPCRTERTNRQYRCARPPFRTTVCRRYTPPHLALVAIATTRAPRKARRLALHPDSASARRIPLALPARCSRRIYFRMPSWGSWASPASRQPAGDERRHACGVAVVGLADRAAESTLLDADLEGQPHREPDGEARGGDRDVGRERAGRQEEHGEADRVADPGVRPVLDDGLADAHLDDPRPERPERTTRPGMQDEAREDEREDAAREPGGEEGQG